MTGANRWAMALFRRSVLKRQKWRALSSMVGRTHSLRCLDIGADNGVISLLFRERGGSWVSADLDAQSVEEIRSLVGTDVVQLNGGPMPFRNAEFHRVVLVDCLEHVRDDRGFLREVARVTKPGGEVVINVPLRKESWLRRFRIAIGQTDQAHGHVRPGYTVNELADLLGDRYDLMAHTTYSRFFSQAIDTVMTWAIRALKGGHQSREAVKGAIVTRADLDRHRLLYVVYAALYPLLWGVSQLDRLLWFRSGYMLLAKAKVRPQ
jgi:SAM-dependent methyltransferase